MVPGLVLVYILLTTSDKLSAEIEVTDLETFIASWLSNCCLLNVIKIWDWYFVGFHLSIPAPTMHGVTLNNKNWVSIWGGTSEGLGKVPAVWAMQKMMGMMLLLENLKNSR